MATEIWVNIGSGNGLLPDGTKPLPEPMLTDPQWNPVTFILWQFHKRCLNHQSLKSVWKLHVLKFHSNFPGANELRGNCAVPIYLHTSGPLRKVQRLQLRRPVSKIRLILWMDAKIWITSLIIIFAVPPICVQDSIFKMSSESPKVNPSLNSMAV